MATTAMKDHPPLVTMEAMLRGSLKRLGDFFQDPQNFGSMTHDVLKGTSVRYQEALDKCELQILNAKWMLEHDLAQARAKRLAKPVEVANPAKRKLSEGGANTATDETPAKKQKAEAAGEEPDHLFTLDEMLKGMEEDNKAEDTPAASTAEAGMTVDPTTAPTTATEQTTSSAPAPALDSQEAEKEPDTTEKTTQPVQDEQPPQTATTQNIDFESMFGNLDDNTGGDNEINFDDLDNLDSTNDFDLMLDDAQPQNTQVENTGTQQGSGGDSQTLNSLLPGVESYANSTDPMGNNMPPNLTSAPQSTNAFDLPDMNASNAFDELFGDMEAVGGDANNNANNNTENKGMTDDDFLNDDSILELGTFDDQWLMD